MPKYDIVQYRARNSLECFQGLKEDWQWCGTWSLTLREEHGLRVFENRVLRRTFGPRRDEVTGD
jgi:hypothetical protein